ARRLRSRGLFGYYCAEASAVHRWRQGGTLEGAARSRTEYERSVRLYHEQSFGSPGRILFAALDAPAAAARLARRLRVRLLPGGVHAVPTPAAPSPGSP